MAIACRNCGNPMNQEARFCSTCGTPASVPQSGPAYTSNVPPAWSVGSRLVRPRAGRMLAGVCQGLANTYAWDVVWVRVIAVLLAIFGGGIGVVAYVVFWIVMPEEPLALPASTAWPPQGS